MGRFTDGHDDRAATAREAAVAARVSMEKEAQAKRNDLRPTSLGDRLSGYAGSVMVFLVIVLLCAIMLMFMAALIFFAYGLLDRAVRSAF